MQEINIEEEIQKGNLKKESSYKDILSECIVDLDGKDTPLDVLVYFGYDDRGKKCPVITRGEFTCIVANAKTKKSFCKSLIAGAYVGGNTNTYTKHITGNRKTEGYIIDLDTEQGIYYARKTFKRTEQLVGNRYDKYVPIQMRKKSVSERLGLIEYLIYESEYAGKIDMIFIDGIADLVYNTNDIEEGAKLSENMLKWTSEGISIVTVIHKAGNNDKARGHLGTAVTIKAESIIFMDRIMNDQGEITEKNTVRVRCGYVRGMDFEDFYLTVNDEGLPFTHSDMQDNVFVSNEFKEDPKPLPTVSVNDAFGTDEDIPF